MPVWISFFETGGKGMQSSDHDITHFSDYGFPNLSYINETQFSVSSSTHDVKLMSYEIQKQLSIR